MSVMDFTTSRVGVGLEIYRHTEKRLKSFAKKNQFGLHRKINNHKSLFNYATSKYRLLDILLVENMNFLVL